MVGSESTVNAAIRFATHMHDGQYSKFTKEPYIFHPLRVMMSVASSGELLISSNTNKAIVLAAAVLHDVMEDCGVVKSQLRGTFGIEVANLVEELTNVPQRKALTCARRNRLSKVSRQAKIIKLHDRLDNICDIRHVPLEYANETYKLLDVIGDADTVCASAIYHKLEKFEWFEPKGAADDLANHVSSAE